MHPVFFLNKTGLSRNQCIVIIIIIIIIMKLGRTTPFLLWISESPNKKKGENLDEAILVIQTIPILESDKHILSIKFHAG